MTTPEYQKRLDRLPVAEVTFAIPTQRFAVTCAISTEETLPVVTEFSIRMIYACGTVSPEQLQIFFGFTEKETAAVIATLLDERLVRWDDDQLGLTPQALALFLESVDNVPRCFRIQEWSGEVYFELISLSPIKRSRGSGRSRALVDLRPADPERESSTRYWAERAFQEHFAQVEAVTFPSFKTHFPLQLPGFGFDLFLLVIVTLDLMTVFLLDLLGEFGVLQLGDREKIKK